ncbi:bifunctional Dynamin/Dynamin GTPase effector/Dynamin [Babesia duncani]|uniref:Bifunctional Dynamin/Dynamin GTPase effector/Dynamin n=1 Tax=Babesia duncani TaxID=323732 RepID=A0AAD9PPB0_9APIC|nr:bifunctional Dynamin/Dynamin GTPase effector/Dynamin [Babesia duncani]
MSYDGNLNLRKLITLVDELKDIGLQKYINLPRICVAGTQSSGKSSVLESIVGIDFLPRGDGIVTRRPIEFRLNRLYGNEEDGTPVRPYIIFEGNEERFYDFEKARSHIQDLTNAVAGINKGIVDEPIVLSVYCADCPDLTLIDLPGVTRVPLKNSDQTDDIEVVTKDMIMRYASDPRTIILAVVSANVDMSTSDALQLAKRADPLGVRTIGVITKIDLMDRGSDAAAMLQNEEVPLRLGYTGVKNRSQLEISKGVSIKEALEKEREFFSTHKVYRTLSPTLWGVDSLVSKLTKVLYRHIGTVLPDLNKEIASRLKSVTERLESLGSGAPVGDVERVDLLWQMVADYCETFTNSIKGKYVEKLVDSRGMCMDAGVQIRVAFNQLLDQFLSEDTFGKISDDDIDQAIQNHEGESLPGYPTNDSFESLMYPQLKMLSGPILECLDKIHNSLEVLSQNVGHFVFGRFPKLCDKVFELSKSIFAEAFEHTRGILKMYIESETCYIFTNDPSYLTIGCEDPKDSKGSNTMTDRASQFTSATTKIISQAWDSVTGSHARRYHPQILQEIRRRLTVYFNIVVRNARDIVPKYIGHFLVRRVQRNMHHNIYKPLITSENLPELFGESTETEYTRRSLKEQQDVLSRAMGVIQRDFGILQNSRELFDSNFDVDLRKNSQSQETKASGSSDSLYSQPTKPLVNPQRQKMESIRPPSPRFNSSRPPNVRTRSANMSNPLFE